MIREILLHSNIEGASILQDQVSGARIVRESSGVCSIILNESAHPAAMVPDGPLSAGVSIGDGSGEVGELLVWVEDGRLSTLEAVDLDGNPIISIDDSAGVAVRTVTTADIISRPTRLECLLTWSREPAIICRLHAIAGMVMFSAEPAVLARLGEMLDDENIAVWLDATEVLLTQCGSRGLEIVFEELVRRRDDHQLAHIFDVIRNVAVDVNPRLVVQAYELAESRNSSEMRKCVAELIRDLEGAPVDLPDLPSWYPAEGWTGWGRLEWVLPQYKSFISYFADGNSTADDFEAAFRRRLTLDRHHFDGPELDVLARLLGAADEYVRDGDGNRLREQARMTYQQLWES